MATHDAKLGKGLSTGMFFHAPAGTALPTYPLETLAVAWVEVGDVNADGITVAFNKSTTDFRNWANQLKRTVMTEHTEDVSVSVMDTTEEALKTVLGDSAVTTTAANATHGKLVNVSLSQDALPDEEAYLFLMKDGDDAIMIGCTNGQIKAMESVAFKPGELINWAPTITALGNGWKMITDDGQTTP